MRAGKPEAILGVEIGILIDRCSDDELELVAESGELPARIIDQRRNIRAMAATAETDAETAALSDEQQQVAQDDVEAHDDTAAQDHSEGPDREQQAGESRELTELAIEAVEQIAEIEKAATG